MYKNKYEVILLLQDKLIREKELELSEIVKKRESVALKFKKEEEKKHLFRTYLMENQTFDPSFFSAATDVYFEQELKKELERVEISLKILRYEYQELLEKKKVIEEMEQKERKKYEKEWAKKQQRKIIGMQSALKHKKNGGG